MKIIEVDHAAGGAADGAADRRAAVVRAIATMRSGLARPQPLASLARTGMFSPFYFHRVFREVTGVTPARFHGALRMAEARRLLLNTSLPVKRIGERVGYRSPGTFCTRFAGIAGLPPAGFRAFVQRLGDEPAAGTLAVRATPPTGHPGATLALSGVPAHGSLVLSQLGRQWTVWPLPGPVRLPVTSRPGAYPVLTVVVPGGVRLADVLVDRPGSYLLGRYRVALPAGDQSAARAHAALRWPEPTDPPSLAITAIDGLVRVVA